MLNSSLAGQRKLAGMAILEKERAIQAKRQSDFILAPRLLLLKSEVQRVMGNFHVFH